MSEMTIEQFGSDLGFLEQPLLTMGMVIDRYVDRFQARYPDCEVPYHYNERATLSQFAGGVWLSGQDNLVLEEFGKEEKKR